MAHLYAYFDQSGHIAEHPVIALCGFVDGFERWQNFQNKWSELLRKYEIRSFRTVDAMRYSQPYGAMRKGNADDRIKDIIPFVRTIRDTLELGITVAVDVTAYRSTHTIVHQAYGKDPDYFAFYEAIARILKYFAIPKQYELALICDDEERQSIRFYEMLKKMKLAIPEVRKRVKSICFSDDTDFPQLQAADLLAYFTRKEADRRFFGRDYKFKELHSEFQSTCSESGKHLHFAGGFFDKDALDKFAAGIREELKKQGETNNREW